jgi:hypothetical protein
MTVSGRGRLQPHRPAPTAIEQRSRLCMTARAGHAQPLSEALARHVAAARRAGAAPAASPGPGESTEVRERVKAQGIEMRDRGRVPAEVTPRSKATTAKRRQNIPGRRYHTQTHADERMDGMTPQQ